MEKPIEFKVIYKGKEYSFNCGAAVYIFDIATCNGFAESHDEKTLLDYIELVRECYIKDDNPTPLGSLADFIAEHWYAVNLLTLREILERFYEEVI